MSTSPARSRNGHAYRPNPPRRFVGPPSWLAEPTHADHLAAAAKTIPPPSSPPPNRHAEHRLLVLGCDHRGADAEPCGCARLHYCLAGKGRRTEGMGVGTVSLADCWACTTFNSADPTVQ